MPEQLASTLGTSQSDNLFAGGVFPVVTGTVTLKAGKSYARGTVLGLLDADGKATNVNSANTDGSQVPYGILADDVDALLVDKQAVVYLTGEFNQATLFFGGTDTAATHKLALRENGIFVKTNQGV